MPVRIGTISVFPLSTLWRGGKGVRCFCPPSALSKGLDTSVPRFYFPATKKVDMYRMLVLALGFFLLGSHVAFSQTAPVKYLAGQSEAGQPHLYWFGAMAHYTYSIIDDGSSEIFAYIAEQFFNNQAVAHISGFPYTAEEPYLLVSEISVLIAPRLLSDTSSTFALSVRKQLDGENLSLDTVRVRWQGETSLWVTHKPAVLIAPVSSYWVGLHWLSDSPTNPLLGRDYSDIGYTSYVCYENSCFPPFLGNWIIRSKNMVNNPLSENADSFWVYRGLDSNSVFYVVTVDTGQFDFVDAPTTGGEYYYRVTRWQGGVESPLSNAIRLTASPTAVEDKQIEKHAFLLSEPFPNPASTSVLFTARTDKQMELGFSIYNLLGQKVFSKPAAGYSAGEHRFFWSGQDVSGRRLPSGLYLLRFQAGEEVLVKKIILLR